jgi:hypothetical protein
MRVLRRHEVVDDAPATDPVVDDDRVVRRTTTAPRAWSPAQLVGLVIGIGFVVLGITALADTGTSHLYTPLTTVWHLGHSPLLGWIDIAFGALLILASIVPGGLRWLMALLGAGSLALGIVIVVDSAPVRLHRWLGINHTNGWLYIVVGAVLILAAFASPIFVSGNVDVRRNAVSDPRV